MFLRGENDNKTIGLLLCKGKDEVVAQYALTGYNQPIGVSDYQLSKTEGQACNGGTGLGWGRTFPKNMITFVPKNQT